MLGGAAGGYAVADDINSFLNGDQEPSGDNGQNGGSDGDNGGTSGGDADNNGDNSDPSAGSDVDRDADIYDILDDSGDTDIELVEDWLGDAYDRGHDVNDIVMGYSDDKDEDYLGFQDNGDVDLPLWLTEENGYSNSEIDTLREYDEEGQLPEVLEPAAE